MHTDGGAGEEQLQSWWGAAVIERNESGTRGRSRSTRLYLSARGLEEQVAREAVTASDGAAQGRPPLVFCPVSRSPFV
ncbi:hypothetical protein VPH35_051756 [Triticum aestivum]